MDKEPIQILLDDKFLEKLHEGIKILDKYLSHQNEEARKQQMQPQQPIPRAQQEQQPVQGQQ